MNKKIVILIIVGLTFYKSAPAQLVFTSLDSLLRYATKRSIVIQTNDIRISQAKKAKLAAILSIPDPTGNMGLNYTDNTQLPISLFPDANNPGKFNEIQIGQKYATQVSQNMNIKLLNLAGWENLKLAKLNIDISNSNQQLSIKSLQENIASNYYNILNLQQQIINSEANYQIADSLLQSVQNKYNKGLVKQQDVNDSKVNVLNSKESIQQLQYLQQQYYVSLKILCDIPENEKIMIAETIKEVNASLAPQPLLNQLTIQNSLLKEKYALSNYKQISKSLMPTISFNSSRAYNLYSQSFKLFDGKWFPSSSIGFSLSIPMPSANSIGNKHKAKYDYAIARKATEQETIKANHTQEQLSIDYYKTLSQHKNNQEVLTLRKDSFYKNRALYEQGIINIDQLLNSYTAMINAAYNLTSSNINVQLAEAKININNTVK